MVFVWDHVKSSCEDDDGKDKGGDDDGGDGDDGGDDNEDEIGELSSQALQ